jgi:hypothetical protein
MLFDDYLNPCKNNPNCLSMSGNLGRTVLNGFGL